MHKTQLSWKKQNKFLDEQSSMNIQIKKQINKQSGMDSILQNSINDKIYMLKVEASDISKKLENQKFKNIQLETIIRALKSRMQDDKRIQSSVINDINSDNNQDSLQRKIRKLQYDLTQLNVKSNKMSSLITQTKNKISALRTQRFIDSSIFRNIQKQLKIYQMEFKKLLIDKIKHEKIYQQTINQYNSLKNKAAIYFNNQELSKRSNQPNFQQSFIQKQPIIISKNNKFKQINKRRYSKQINTQSNQSKNQDHNIYYQFLVRKFLLNLNLKTGKEFIYLNNNIQSINDQYFNQLNQKADLITKIQLSVKQIQQLIQHNSISFYQQSPELTPIQKNKINCKLLKQQINNNKSQLQSKVTDFKSFLISQNFKDFNQILQLNNKTQQELDLQCLVEQFKQIQQKMNGMKLYRPLKQSYCKQSQIQKQNREQKLEDVLNRIKISSETQKLMDKEQFLQEYKKIKSGPHSLSIKRTKNPKSKKILF